MRTQALSLMRTGGLAMRRLGLIVFYVVVFTVAVPLQVWALGTRLDALFRLPAIEALRAPGCVLLGVGVTLWLSAHLWFSATGRGLPMSSLPPTRLVASGPYAWFRHPIYLGFTLAAAGLGCSLGSLGHGFLAPMILGSGCWAYVVSFEGPALRKRYGDAYQQVGRVAFGGQLLSGGWIWLRDTVEQIANRTILFRVGPMLSMTYGLFVALGAFLVALFGRGAVGELCSPGQYLGYSTGLALLLALGARHAWFGRNLAAPRRRWLAELHDVNFVHWGGLAGLLVFTAAFGAAIGIHPLAILDRLMPLLFLCMAFCCAGCLTSGCCFGRPSPGGVRWTHPDAKVVRMLGDLGSLPRAPVQLLVAVVSLLAAALTVVLNLRKGAVGTTTLFSLLWYCLARLGLEQLRDEPRIGRLQWTRAQWIAAGGAGLSLVLLMSLDSTVTVTVRRSSLDLLALGTAVTVGGVVFALSGLRWRRDGRW